MITIIIPLHPSENLNTISKCLDEIEKNYCDIKNIRLKLMLL